MKRPLFTGLWRHSDFRKLWAALTIAQFGTQITFFAMQLTAIVVLEATAAQMGILMALLSLPALLIGLVIGAWVDRVRRRMLLVSTDIGRAFLLAAVPVLVWLDVLVMEHLFALAFLYGTLTLAFNVAYRSFLPSLIERSQLVDGNSKLEVSRSAAEIGGPGIAGVLIQAVTAPVAMLVHSASLLISAGLLGAIRAPEIVPQREPGRHLRRDISEGLRFVFGSRILRPLASCTATFGFFNAVIDAVLLLYISQQIGLSASVIGLIFMAGNFGFLLGALMPQRLTRWIGLGPALGAGLLTASVGDLLIPLAGGPYLLILGTLVMAQFMFGAGFIVFNINQVSLRQALTPDRLQGRMNATMSLMLYGIFPAGALAGGLLGTTLGLRTTLIVAACGEILAILWLILSPAWSMKEHPASTDAG